MTWFFSETHERDAKNLSSEISDLHQRRDAALADLSDLKSKLRLSEEAREQLKRDLAEVNRSLQEGNLIQSSVCSNEYLSQRNYFINGHCFFWLDHVVNVETQIPLIPLKSGLFCDGMCRYGVLPQIFFKKKPCLKLCLRESVVMV